jgi:ribosomal protein S21
MEENRQKQEGRNNDKKKRTPRQELYLYGHANGVKVINNNVESAIRAWKRIMKDSGIMDEIRERREYKKPTTVRREKRNAAIRAEWVRRRREE